MAETISKLDRYCSILLNNVEHPGDITPTDMAELFWTTGQLGRLVNSADISRLINRFQLNGYRPPIRMQDSLERKQYQQNYWQNTPLQSHLKEFYQNLQTHISTKNPDYRSNDPDQEAEAFIASLLGPTDKFQNDIYHFGYNILALHGKYNRDYSVLLKRLGHLLSDHHSFIGIHYKLAESDHPRHRHSVQFNMFRVASSIQTQNILQAKQHDHLLWTSMPVQGGGIAKGSVAEHVFKTKSSIVREDATGFDLFGLDNMLVIGRPVFEFKRLTHIIVIAIPSRLRHLAVKQIQAINPRFIPTAFQII